MRVNLHKCTVLPACMAAHVRAASSSHPTAVDRYTVPALIVLSVRRADLIGLLGCFYVLGNEWKRYDVLRRKQTPTDDFNIQQMKSPAFHACSLVRIRQTCNGFPIKTS